LLLTLPLVFTSTFCPIYVTFTWTILDCAAAGDAGGGSGENDKWGWGWAGCGPWSVDLVLT